MLFYSCRFLRTLNDALNTCPAVLLAARTLKQPVIGNWQLAISYWLLVIGFGFGFGFGYNLVWYCQR
jgi:hypothetical protein